VSVVCNNRTVTVIRGSSKTLRVTVQDSSETPIDISGSTVFFSAKEKVSDTVALISKNSTNPAEIALTDPTNGVAEIYLVPSDTQSLDSGRLLYDVWIVLVSGARHSIIQSELIVESSITVIP